MTTNHGSETMRNLKVMGLTAIAAAMAVTATGLTPASARMNDAARTGVENDAAHGTQALRVAGLRKSLTTGRNRPTHATPKLMESISNGTVYAPTPPPSTTPPPPAPDDCMSCD